MANNLSYDTVEKLVVQIFSMNCCLGEYQVKLDEIFHILDQFWSLLINCFEKEKELIRDMFCAESVFVLPESIKKLNVTMEIREDGRQKHTYRVGIIKNALEDGKAVKLKYKLPIGGDFEFRVVPNDEQTHARIEHCWHGGDETFTENWMAIPLIILLISDLGNQEDWMNAQKTLFPNHQMNRISMENPVRQQWEITNGYIYHPDEVLFALWKSTIKLSDILGSHTQRKLQGILKFVRDNIINAYWRRELGLRNTALKEANCESEINEINELSCLNEEVTMFDITMEDLETVEETGAAENLCRSPRNDRLTSNQCAPAIGTAIGFVFTGAGVIDIEQSCEEKRNTIDVIKKVAAETASGGVTTGIGAVSKVLGGSVIGVGGIVAVASLALSSAYDSIRLTKGKMTKIEFRKNAASNLGGAAGGLLAGVGTTLLVTFAVSNPVGWALTLGAGAVGVVGGIAGAFGGKKIDKAIWDEGIDQVVHVYGFFGFKIARDCQSTPIFSPTVLMESYTKRVKEGHDPEGKGKGKGKEDLDWERKCQALFMLLLKFMFPVYMDLLEMTSIWEEKFKSSKKYEKEILYFFVDLLDER